MGTEERNVPEFKEMRDRYMLRIPGFVQVYRKGEADVA